jgi:hypothetical protein
MQKRNRVQDEKRRKLCLKVFFILTACVHQVKEILIAAYKVLNACLQG